MTLVSYSPVGLGFLTRHWDKRVRVRCIYSVNVQTKRMAKKLYVGGLPYAMTDDRLKEVFGQTGDVESANVIIDRMTGKSRGFGFVTMTNDEDASKAIDMFNGKDLDGRTITVNEARPMQER